MMMKDLLPVGTGCAVQILERRFFPLGEEGEKMYEEVVNKVFDKEMGSSIQVRWSLGQQRTHA